MSDQFGGRSAVSDAISTVTNHGGIASMTLPQGFAPVRLTPDQSQHNQIEFKWLASTVRICYEEMREPLMEDDLAEMQKLFGETANRRLNLYGEDESLPDDSIVYGALCMCFVFGGSLVRDGSCIDMDESKWELRRIGDKTTVFARLHFTSASGNRSSREAILVIPIAPSASGTSYIWLEGTKDELRRHEPAFITAIETGSFQPLN